MKFAIIFCLVTFACVAYAQNEVVPDTEIDAKTRSSIVESAKQKLEEAKQKVDELINQASDLLKQKINEVKLKAEELAEKLKNGAVKVTDKIYETVKKILDTVDNKVGKIAQYANSEGIDVSECTTMTQTLREAALAIVSNSSYCIVEKLEKGKGLMSDISYKAELALAELTKIRTDANECIKDVSGVKAIAVAVGCVTSSGVKASWAITKLVPSVAYDMAKIGAMMATLQPSLAFCMTKNSVTSVIQESRQVFTSIKQCINEKVEEAQTSNEDFDFDIDEPLSSIEEAVQTIDDNQSNDKGIQAGGARVRSIRDYLSKSQ